MYVEICSYVSYYYKVVSTFYLIEWYSHIGTNPQQLYDACIYEIYRLPCIIPSCALT